MASDSNPEEPQPQAAEPDLDLEIETIGAWVPDLEEGLDPHHDPELAVAPCGRPARSGRRLYVDAGALRKMTAHAGSEALNEVGGVLLGHLYTSRGHVVTDVRDSLPAPLTRAGGAHVTFSHDTWAAIFQQMDPQQGATIVGWYHSHPGFGVFLSRQDEFIQENFFDHEAHVAVVVDPRKRRMGAFTWHEGRVVPMAGFWVSAPQDQADRARWLARHWHYEAIGEGAPAPGLLSSLLGALTGHMRRD